MDYTHQVWELIPKTRGKPTLLYVVLRHEPDPLSGTRSLRLLCLETGEELNRAIWLFDDSNTVLKSSPAMQDWRRVL